MTAIQPPLWPEGWDLEPCGDGREAVPREQPRPVRPRREVGTREPHTLGGRVRTVRVEGGLL